MIEKASRKTIILSDDIRRNFRQPPASPMTTTIFIRLLDEGTEVFRPTEAEILEGGIFKLLPTSDYDPEDEHWEFILGTVVRGVPRKLEGGDVLIAVGLNYNGGSNAVS